MSGNHVSREHHKGNSGAIKRRKQTNEHFDQQKKKQEKDEKKKKKKDEEKVTPEGILHFQGKSGQLGPARMIWGKKYSV